MKEYLGCVADDWRSNRGFYVEFVWLFTFRSASYLRNSKLLCVRVIGLPFRVIQRIVSLIVFSIDIPTRTVIGSGLCVRHGFGLVVHADAILGRGVLLRHGVTIGATERGVPVIKDDVDIGASAIILGDVVIGEGAVVGAGAVVVCDVPPMAVVVGNPARVVSAG